MKKTPKGKTPSLISGSNGRPKRVPVERKSACGRCAEDLLAGTQCIVIPQIGGAFTKPKRYCDGCYKDVLEQTTKDFEEIKQL